MNRILNKHGIPVGMGNNKKIFGLNGEVISKDNVPKVSLEVQEYVQTRVRAAHASQLEDRRIVIYSMKQINTQLSKLEIVATEEQKVLIEKIKVITKGFLVPPKDIDSVKKKPS